MEFPPVMLLDVVSTDTEEVAQVLLESGLYKFLAWGSFFIDNPLPKVNLDLHYTNESRFPFQVHF